MSWRLWNIHDLFKIRDNFLIQSNYICSQLNQFAQYSNIPQQYSGLINFPALTSFQTKVYIHHLYRGIKFQTVLIFQICNQNYHWLQSARCLKIAACSKTYFAPKLCICFKNVTFSKIKYIIFKFLLYKLLYLVLTSGLRLKNINS